MLVVAKSLAQIAHPMKGAPTIGQAEAGNYRKRTIAWHGLVLAIENEAGSLRSGKSRGGVIWERRIHFPYGYVKGTDGVDGDEVDIYVGPHLEDAKTVYVIHQRKYGDWKAYDEDKCMLGFASQQEAEAAYLMNYDDPRFLGPVTAMSVDEFVAKAKATKGDPKMIKAMILLKAHIKAYTRKDGTTVVTHEDRRPGAQMDLFHPAGARTGEAHETRAASVAKPEPKYSGAMSQAESVANQDRQLGYDKIHRDAALDAAAAEEGAQAKPETPVPEGHTQAFYATMRREHSDPAKRTAWLAGPFSTHDEASGHVAKAREAAVAMDPWHHFNAFGTSSITKKGEHRPGMLNRHLGIGGTAEPMAKALVVFAKAHIPGAA